MRVRVNEIWKEVAAGTSLFRLKEGLFPTADVFILNSFPVQKDLALQEGDEVVLIERGKRYSSDELNSLLSARHSPGVQEKISQAVVGIAGLGGLGSTAALALARLGIGALVIADFDVVEPSNINRQQYFLRHIGQYKTEALKEMIADIHPGVIVRSHRLKLTPETIPSVFDDVPVIVEALDSADQKEILIRTVLGVWEKTYIISGTGMAGYGPANAIETVYEGRLVLCGDQTSEARQGWGLMAPRVGVCAHHQANAVLRLIMGLDQ